MEVCVKALKFGLIGGLLVLSSLGFSTRAFAVDEGDVRLGVMAGHVGLMGDVASGRSNSLGYGAVFGYASSDQMIFELGYLQSAHDNLTHSEMLVGLNYYLGSYDALYPQITGGVSFLSNKFRDTTNPIPNTDISSNGFGLYFGGGIDFEMGSHLLAGIQGRYNKAFDTTVTLANGSSVKAIQDNITVMLRVIFTLGSGSSR